MQTPTPWRLGTDGNVYSGETGGELLLIVLHLGGEQSVKGENGRLVVKAANLHKKLVAALKGLIEPAEFGDMEQSPPGFWGDRIEAAKAVLAEAQ